jgi:malonate-semialdehyde dehydrogenase (acetylating)/methylmalonate-semialdehyde dehydrogenase
MYGPDGVHFYTRTKVVTSRWPAPRTGDDDVAQAVESTVDLGFPQNR